jgi:hypothetical protein
MLFLHQNASYITVYGLTINGLVRAGDVTYLNNALMTFVDSVTVQLNAGNWSSAIMPGDILYVTGAGPNGYASGYEVDAVSGNTLTILNTGGFLFTPEADVNIYQFYWYRKHHNITMDSCVIRPNGGYAGEIFEMNMGNNISLLRTELDGNNLVFMGATYNESRKHATMRYNHTISECYIHHIGDPGGTNSYDNHAVGIQKVNGYVLEKTNCEHVACGMVLYPGGADEGADPSAGVFNVVIRYNRFAFNDLDRHLTQFPGCGIMGIGEGNEMLVGTWKVYHNLIIDPIGDRSPSPLSEVNGIAQKGDSSDGMTSIYNNTIYNTPAGIGWSQGIYCVNLSNGGEVKNNIVHGVKQSDQQHCQTRTAEPANTTYESDYNLYSADWSGGFRVGTFIPTDFAGLQANGYEANGRVGDPMLDEITFRPQPGSPAIGNGVLMDANQRWLGNVVWPTGPGGGSFEFIDLTSSPTIGAFAETT